METIFAERLGEFHGIIAEHFFHGEAWDKALAYFTQAGDAAAGLYAHAEARVYNAKALEALAHLPDTEEVLRPCGSAAAMKMGWCSPPGARGLLSMTPITRRMFTSALSL